MTAALHPDPDTGFDPLDVDTRTLLRRAAAHAPHALPGPVGQVLARELCAWEQFGYRFGGRALMERLAADVLARPVAR